MSSKRPSEELVQRTIAYYDENAQGYYECTVDLDMSALYEPFLSLLPQEARILDAGCGSGRDAAYFQSQGHEVVAFDASKEMVRISSRHLGQETLHRSFRDLQFKEEFDGVWACASLLHVPSEELPDALEKLARSLKEGGVMYCSFKEGAGEHFTGGRHFNEQTIGSARGLVDSIAPLKTIKLWISRDRDRSMVRWINLLARKSFERQS